MPEYRVTWEINVEAASPMEAAQIARDTQLDWESLATIFTVEAYGSKREHIVDLDPAGYSCTRVKERKDG